MNSLILLTFFLSVVCHSSKLFYIDELDKRIDLIVNIRNLSKTIFDNFNTDRLGIDIYDRSLIKDNENTKKIYVEAEDNSLKSYGSSKDDDYYDSSYEKNGLSNSCNNKFCTMLKFLLSCKAIGFGVSKYCARYMLGYIYDCENMFNRDLITDAPSTCLGETFGFLQILANQTSFGMLLGKYLGKDFESNSCGRRCYQNYQYASHDFYFNCKSQLNATKIPLVTGISLYQEFRNQACAHNGTKVGTGNDVNCYETVTNLAKSAQQNPSAPNILDFTCNYTTDSTTNYQIQGGTCAELSKYGCCATTGITIVHQNQLAVLQSAMSSTPPDFTVFPPCLMRFLHSSIACPGVELLNYCRNGSIATTSAMTGSIFLANNDPPGAGELSFPNVYNKTITIQLQAAITNALVNANPVFRGPPYYLNPDYPFQIQIIDYVYYDDQKVAMVSPLPGGTYTPSQVDYRDAAYGNFTYQIVTQDLNEDDANELYSFLENPVFKNILATIYGDTGGSTTNVAAGSTPINHLANPLEISAGNSNSIQKRYYILFNIFMLVSTILYLY